MSDLISDGGMDPRTAYEAGRRASTRPTYLTGEPKAFTGNQPRRWRVKRCHACTRLVYACRSKTPLLNCP